MIDFQATAAILYPTVPQNAQTVLPVEAKPTTDPAATTTAEPRATDATHTTTDQTTTTAPQPDIQYTLALPQDAVLESSAIERMTAFAKANHLSPDVAQQALNHANAEVVADRDQQTDAWRTLTRETWVNEVKRDPEIGGEKYTGAVTGTKRFLAEFGDEEIRQFLDDTGFGNNKFVIRLLSRAMARMETEKRRSGSGEGGERKSDAEVLYGNTSRR
jgi:hypothetical protein